MMPPQGRSDAARGSELSTLIHDALQESPRRITRFSPAVEALADALGLPADDVAVKTVDQVSSVLKTRLGEWGTWKPGLRVGVIVLESARGDRIERELDTAAAVTRNAMTGGVAKGDAVLFLANPTGGRRGWAASMLVERAGSDVAAAIAREFPGVRREVVEDAGGGAAPARKSGPGGSDSRSPDAPAVWIELTLSTHDHGGAGWELGKCLWSPTRDRADRDRYAIMREPKHGDVVLHFVDSTLTGYSRVRAEVVEIQGGPPSPGPWEGMSPYYRIELEQFRRVEREYSIAQLLADHGDALREDLRSNKPPRYPFYQEGSGTLRTVQGAYLTRCSPVLYEILTEEAKLPPLPVRATGQPKADVAAGTRYWAIAAGEGGRVWSAFRDESIIAIGWDKLGDLRDYDSKEEIAEALGRLYDKPTYPSNDSLACYQFCRDIRVGDRVLVKRGVSEVLAFGEVTSDYDYEPGRPEFRNVRRVRWLSVGPWELPQDLQLPQKTLTDITAYEELLNHLRPVVEAAPRPKRVKEAEPPAYTIDDALERLFLDRADFVRMYETLLRKRNLVVEGPPGVGKTFVAKRLAYALLGYKDPTKVEMVQFHQSYSYEDFVRGWRPNRGGGFSLRDGVFVRFCERAHRDPDGRYVFIIDEINRGNLSKIFGELLMLLEVDKRGPDYAVPLAYSRDDEEGRDARFFVPENVYVLGMMNTADRSLAMVDYALRRRFGFTRLVPAFENPKFTAFLRDRGVVEPLVTRIVERMSALNAEIVGDVKSLGPGFEIGHSFFCPHGTEEDCGPEWYDAVIRSEVEPLLREYWFDAPDRVAAAVAQLLE